MWSLTQVSLQRNLPKLDCVSAIRQLDDATLMCYLQLYGKPVPLSTDKRRTALAIAIGVNPTYLV